jgi:pSer/pThr/pTyr-binding forkhead associated (FHA) protein
MTAAVSESRALALRVARSLRDKGRADEAILILSAWAASGPNDAEGQALLAEALRIDPKSDVAKMAFERMENTIFSDHTVLEMAMARYPATELAKLDRAARPVFQRAQVGFNNNVRYKGKVYHVQTEDSGLSQPHVISHLFSDGGRILKSHKRTYTDAVQRDDVVLFVRALMKGQHMEMVQALRDGTFDPIIEGQRSGGMEVLEHPPAIDVGQVGGDKQRAGIRRPTPPPAESKAPVRATLHVLRSLSGGPEQYELRSQCTIIGSSGTVSLPGERFCHPREAMLSWEGDRLWLDDLEGGNGVFVRIHGRVAIPMGTEFVLGDQLLRLDPNPEWNDGPDEGPVYFLSSYKGPSAFRVVQLFEGGAVGASALAREALLQIGSAHEYANDLVLLNDPLVARYHATIEEQAEVHVLTDLGAKSGVFVRVAGRHPLANGDELLIGRTRLSVELPGASGAA